MESLKISIDPSIEARCQFFAENCVKTNIDQYKKRNQHNLERIIEQIKTGKIAEFASYIHFKKFGETTHPDLSIYSACEKSFDTDLFFENHVLHRLHVKSQKKSESRRYGTSWVFQIEDPIMKNYESLDDIMVFSVVNDNYREVEIKVIQKVSDLFKDVAFKEMKLEYLRNSKKAIYFDDIKETYGEANIINHKLFKPEM